MAGPLEDRVVPIAHAARRRQPATDQCETVTVICARPKCRQEFQRPLARGRRKDYCSAECRRIVDSERRRTNARLAHHEQSAARLRADLDAFSAGQSNGIAGSEEQPVGSSSDLLNALAVEVARSEGILQLADASDPVTQQLACLVEGVNRLLTSRAAHK